MILTKSVHFVGLHCNNSHYGVNAENNEQTFHKSQTLRCNQRCKEYYDRQNVPSDKTVCLLDYSENVSLTLMPFDFYF